MGLCSSFLMQLCYPRDYMYAYVPACAHMHMHTYTLAILVDSIVPD